jgi:predicted nuclease with TOPRIM domain
MNFLIVMKDMITEFETIILEYEELKINYQHLKEEFAKCHIKLENVEKEWKQMNDQLQIKNEMISQLHSKMEQLSEQKSKLLWWW